MSNALAFYKPQTLPPVRQRPNTRGAVVVGLIALLAFGCGFAVWAAMAPLSSAAIAPGKVRVEGNRKTVQHLEGGIIHELLVREGDTVTKGQVLVRLDDTQAGASAELLRTQHDALLAQDARLSAERDAMPFINFPQPLVQRGEDPRVDDLLQSQRTIFTVRRQTHEGLREMLERRIDQLREEIDSHRAQMQSSDKQLALVNEEVTGLQTLYDKGLAPLEKLQEKKRAAAALQGNRESKRANIAQAEQRIAEARLQAAQLQKERMDEVAAEQREVRDRLVEVEEKLRAATDVEKRTEILAPLSGKVVNLRFFTTGGVVQPGQPILDIVPDDETMLVEAHVDPKDIDVVKIGLDAEVRLTAYKSELVPPIPGRVANVSADALTDERTGATYYKADVTLDREQIDAIEAVTLQPGMPAEVMIRTGQRTLFAYLTQPVRDRFNRAFREQ